MKKMNEMDIFLWWKYNYHKINIKNIKILNYGKLNYVEGPDILNVRYLYNGNVKVGDVEIHLSDKDWYNHNHQYNEDYNNVFLHLYIQQSYDRFITRKNDDTFTYSFYIRPVNIKKNKKQKINNTYCYNFLKNKNIFFLINSLIKFGKMRIRRKYNRLNYYKNKYDEYALLFFTYNLGLPNNKKSFYSIMKKYITNGISTSDIPAQKNKRNIQNVRPPMSYKKQLHKIVTLIENKNNIKNLKSGWTLKSFKKFLILDLQLAVGDTTAKLLFYNFYLIYMHQTKTIYSYPLICKTKIWRWFEQVLDITNIPKLEIIHQGFLYLYDYCKRRHCIECPLLMTDIMKLGG